MKQSRLTTKCALLTAAICFAGCGDEQDVANSTSVVSKATEVANVQPNKTRGSAVVKTRELTAEAEIEVFAPPYARRTDLFQRPDATKAAGIVRKRREERGGDVQLKGFVHVDHPRAMLQVDGQLWIAGVGDEKNDLKVAEVSPPNVLLERAGNPVRLSLRDGG